MKSFDLKSLVAGVLLAMVVVTFTLIATGNSPRSWEYMVVQSYVGPDTQNRLNAAATNRWELVNVAVDPQHGIFSVLRRPTATRSRWAFWKK
jgi:hypothetical protein